MSSTAVPRSVASRPPRVREQARDAAALMLFSGATSAGLTIGLFLLTQLGR